MSNGSIENTHSGIEVLVDQQEGHGLKRKQSEQPDHEEQDNKRPRVGQDKPSLRVEEAPVKDGAWENGTSISDDVVEQQDELTRSIDEKQTHPHEQTEEKQQHSRECTDERPQQLHGRIDERSQHLHERIDERPQYLHERIDKKQQHPRERTDEPARTDIESDHARDPATRKPPGRIDEKQRSRRLFGSLIGTLGQRGDHTVRKRQEIESRRKAELKQQDDARLEDRQQRVKHVTEKREQEQWKVDQADMNIRHRNLRHAANFLQTRASPKLYYRPWDLQANEDAQIEKQKQAAEDQVEAEVEAFQKQRAVTANKDRPCSTIRGSRPESLTDAAEMAGSRDTAGHIDKYDHRTDRGVVKEPDVQATQSTTTEPDDGQPQNDGQQNVDGDQPMLDEGPAPDTPRSELLNYDAKTTAEHDDEHMVEGDEDNVIY